MRDLFESNLWKYGKFQLSNMRLLGKNEQNCIRRCPKFTDWNLQFVFYATVKKCSIKCEDWDFYSITYLSHLCWVQRVQKLELPMPQGPQKLPDPNSTAELTGKLHLKLQWFQWAGWMPQPPSKQGQRSFSPSWDFLRFVGDDVEKRKAAV